MKKSSRRHRFFALGEERTPSAFSREGRATPGEIQPPEESSEEEFTQDEEEGGEPVSGEAGQRESESAEGGALPPAFALSRIPRERSQKKRGMPAGAVVGIAFACLLAGGLGGYFWPKPAASAERSSAPANPTAEIKLLTAAEQEALDAAYEARHRQRYEEARERFATLSQEHPEWKWLEVERGRTLLFEGKVVDARLALLNAVEKSSQPGEANYLLAAAYMVERVYPRAETLFATAVALDPMRPEYYYLWGDCLRTDGKPLEAAGKFRAALLRNTFETADPFYRLKLWLCQIEADQEKTDGLNETLDAELAGPHPSMQVLFAAAARAIKGGDFKAAAGLLRQARLAVDPLIFSVLLNDPTFRQVSARPEMAELFQPETSGKGNGARPAPGAPAEAAPGASK